MKTRWLKTVIPMFLIVIGSAGLSNEAAAQQRGANANVFYDVRVVRPPNGDRVSINGLPATTPATPEEAARTYLLASVRQQRVSANGFAPAPQNSPTPAFSRTQTVDLPATNTKLVRFAQTQNGIPVFGTNAVVEVDSDRQLVSIYAKLAVVSEVSTKPRMTADDALQALLKRVKPWVERVQPSRPPSLNVYHDDRRGWRLAYLFQNVPAKPLDYDGKDESSFGGPSRERFNFLVDAQDGGILRFFAGALQVSSASPPGTTTSAAVSVPRIQTVSFVNGAQRRGTPIQTPVLSQGFDDDGELREFNSVSQGKVFALDDPMRHIRTFDMGFRSPFDSRPPNLPSNATPDFGHGFEHFVSAHANAQKVFDFYNDVLKRKGILDDRTYLVSLVDCMPFDDPARQWPNAQWDGDQMLYGQAKDGHGRLRTYARFVDAVGHELTHGVIQNWGPLMNENQAGALNESIADIMGVLIKNWDPNQPNQTVAKFNWEVGSGLKNGGPLRDLSNPLRTKSPDHMKMYVSTRDDHGGVHANANIHNKAAYNLLTAVDAKGQPIVPWKQVALIYYYAESKLHLEATFSEMRRNVQDQAAIIFSGSADRAEKLKAIGKAYDDVGIK